MRILRTEMERVGKLSELDQLREVGISALFPPQYSILPYSSFRSKTLPLALERCERMKISCMECGSFVMKLTLHEHKKISCAAWRNFVMKPMLLSTTLS